MDSNGWVNLGESEASFEISKFAWQSELTVYGAMKERVRFFEFEERYNPYDSMKISALANNFQGEVGTSLTTNHGLMAKAVAAPGGGGSGGFSYQPYVPSSSPPLPMHAPTPHEHLSEDQKLARKYIIHAFQNADEAKLRTNRNLYLPGNEFGAMPGEKVCAVGLMTQALKNFGGEIYERAQRALNGNDTSLAANLVSEMTGTSMGAVQSVITYNDAHSSWEYICNWLLDHWKMTDAG